MLQTKKITYFDGELQLEGYCAYDDNLSGKRPAILVAHDWSGRNEFACHKAEQLAALGYLGFAIDMYGHAKIGNDNDEKMALMKPLIEDRSALSQRIQAALNTVKQFEQTDPAKIGAIGFCFGGLCVLDLARTRSDVTGVVSFHGNLNAPDDALHPIQAKVLVIHGHDDPMIPPEQVLAFEKEMTQANADWQVLVYGKTLHAFTNPLANDPGFGTVYNAVADRRSWVAMTSFFTEIL